MLSRPAGYAEAISHSHDMSAVADVYRSGLQVYGSLPVTGGSVTMDRTAQYRRSATFQVFNDPNLASVLPTSSLGVLAPYGNEVKIRRGLRVGSSMTYFDLGVFGLSQADVNDEGAPSGTVTAYDRSRRVSRNAFTDPYIIGAGQNYVTAMSTLLLNRLPGTTVISTATAELTPLLVLDAGADPWEELSKMADGIGYECFFDGSGAFVLQPVPVPSLASVDWTYTEGLDATLLDVGKSYSDEPGYNGVVLTAESTTLAAPLRSVIWDTDASSPTYYLGPYGQVPMFVTSQYVASQIGADAAARAELQRSIGGTEQVTLGVIVNPAHELGDTVSVVRAASGVNDLCLVESMEVPLGPADKMPITTKRRRTT